MEQIIISSWRCWCRCWCTAFVFDPQHLFVLFFIVGFVFIIDKNVWNGKTLKIFSTKLFWDYLSLLQYNFAFYIFTIAQYYELFCNLQCKTLKFHMWGKPFNGWQKHTTFTCWQSHGVKAGFPKEVQILMYPVATK